MTLTVPLGSGQPLVQPVQEAAGASGSERVAGQPLGPGPVLLHLGPPGVLRAQQTLAPEDSSALPTAGGSVSIYVFI